MTNHLLPMRLLPWKYLFFLLLFISACRSSDQPEQEAAAMADPANLLEAYVNEVDPVFDFEHVKTMEGEGHTTHVLRMTSQRWLDESIVENPVWWHYVQVVVPDETQGNTGLMYVGGGGRNLDLPSAADELLLQSALATKTITAGIHNIPNQPLQFIGDDYGPRVEDEIIAYGWRKFLEGGARNEDAVWLSRFPMTTAVVRAMDAVTAFTAEQLEQPVERFVVAGGSKRGWTTWMTAVVDDRVVAIVPFVIDLLNVIPSFQHHWRAYGFWAPAVQEYVREGIMEWQGSREYERLIELVEPYSYHEEITIPKFLINAAGDEFFLPDSWRFYYPELKGESHLRYVPNTGHSLAGTDALESFIAFYYGIVHDIPRPAFDWRAEEGAILIETDPDFPPSEMRLWQAYNPDARDFRKPLLGNAYESRKITLQPNGKYRVAVPVPEEGWRAFFVELMFDNYAPLPLKLTTGVVVVPDRYPYPPFVSEDPQGKRE